MVQPSLFSSVFWTVSRLTAYIRRALEGDPMLQDVWIRGELSNLSQPSSGHVYFTLKDANASLRGVMWKSQASRLSFALRDGMEVEVHGSIGVYEAGGQYQLYADVIRLVGEGALYAEFLRLKALLEAEGVFDPKRKRPIPRLPRRIGIVTSATGAALRDILNTLRRRLPMVEAILAPSLVQGEEAPATLVQAIEAVNRYAPDVILIARGGGSLEDLWAFNDERVVWAVAASQAPVISGIGHETDFTLTDFAADLRAPTPTGAAELATPLTIADLASRLGLLQRRMQSTFQRNLQRRQLVLANLQERLNLASPLRRLRSEQQRLEGWSRRLVAAQAHRLELDAERLSGLRKRLLALSPFEVLARGYAIVTRQVDGRLIRSVEQAVAGEGIRIRVADGQFEARIASS